MCWIDSGLFHILHCMSHPRVCNDGEQAFGGGGFQEPEPSGQSITVIVSTFIKIPGGEEYFTNGHLLDLIHKYLNYNLVEMNCTRCVLGTSL